jgi:hypothetical protein
VDRIGDTERRHARVQGLLSFENLPRRYNEGGAFMSVDKAAIPIPFSGVEYA